MEVWTKEKLNRTTGLLERERIPTEQVIFMHSEPAVDMRAPANCTADEIATMRKGTLVTLEPDIRWIKDERSSYTAMLLESIYRRCEREMEAHLDDPIFDAVMRSQDRALLADYARSAMTQEERDLEDLTRVR